jgi:hypothetical protein
MEDTLMFELARLTDNARATVKAAFRDQRASTEQNLIAMMAKRTRGVGMYLLAETAVRVSDLPAHGIPIERQSLLSRATEIARQRGVNYVGTEHLLIAVVSLPGSVLAANGVTAERLGTVLSVAEARWKTAHPPIARRMGMWCRSIMKWIGCID